MNDTVSMPTVDPYRQFLEAKAVTDPATGLHVVPALNPALFDFQRDMVTWALRRGRAAMFCDCGMGKTVMQLEWARYVPGDVLVLAPLAVATQTVREGAKFGIEVRYCRSQDDVRAGITVANYEMLQHFDPAQFAGVVLDESSILKAYDGKTRTQIIDAFKQTPFRLACTATPAPNDYMELGNHAEFLGVMTRAEMLAMFFVHDGGDTSQWRLKGHAESEFWKWLCSWAVMIRKPSDLGYDDGAFILPEMVMHQVEVRVEDNTAGFLFPVEALTLQERLQARRDTIAERVAHCAAIVKGVLGIGFGVSNEQGSAESLHAGVCEKEPAEIQANASTAGEGQCPEARAIRNRRDGASGRAISGQGLAGPQPREAKEPEAAGIRDRVGRSQGLDGRAERPLRNLRAVGHEQADGVSGCGSLPQDRSGSGAAVRKLQQGVGALQGRHQSSVLGRDVSEEKFIVWCNLNDEGDALEKAIPGAVQVRGSDSREFKERAVADFQDGRIRVLISKVSIFGFGLNLQSCRNMAFVGLSDSYEQFYQAVRRCWRFGQKRTVNVYVITAETEGAVVANIKRKEADAMRMAENMVKHMQELNAAALHGATQRQKADYVRDVQSGEGWAAHLADCIDVARELLDDSLHFSMYSPPFASLYTYSNSDRDMGNCKGADDFMEHYRFVVRELFRSTMPGRLTAFHCMNLPTSKVTHGHIGIRDFRGDLIRVHEQEGWIYHSEVTIWKDPVTAMQRTKALGLLWKQLKKDSAMSRQGIPDYLVVMRKPGDNPENIAHDSTDFPVELWQNYASPVWMDINPSDTLQFRSAREHNDERHICPLQLGVIERAIKLWTNPRDLVFSPFMGIGSEGYVALQMGRRFLGAELKRSYWEQACRNLAQAHASQGGLFAA